MQFEDMLNGVLKESRSCSTCVQKVNYNQYM